MLTFKLACTNKKIHSIFRSYRSSTNESILEKPNALFMKKEKNINQAWSLARINKFLSLLFFQVSFRTKLVYSTDRYLEQTNK